jgi:hypothetical protein
MVVSLILLAIVVSYVVLVAYEFSWPPSIPREGVATNSLGRARVVEPIGIGTRAPDAGGTPQRTPSSGVAPTGRSTVAVGPIPLASKLHAAGPSARRHSV